MESYRILPDVPVYFVTFSVVEWLPIFIAEKSCQIVAESLNYCHREKSLRVNAYVIMPTHLHAIVFDADFKSERLKDALTNFRKFTGRRLADFCDMYMPCCFRTTLRDKALDDRDRRVWQPSKHPEAIFSELFWMQKLDYLHDNPRRKGLVTRAEHWRFSSAAYLLSDGKCPCDVILSPIVW